MGNNAQAVFGYGISLGDIVQPDEGLAEAYAAKKGIKTTDYHTVDGLVIIESGEDGAIEILLFVEQSHVRLFTWDKSETVNLDRNTVWDVKLEEFCDTMGMTYSKPSWRLGAYYG